MPTERRQPSTDTAPRDPADVVIRQATPEDLEIAGQICVDAYEAAGQLDDGPHHGYAAVLADTGSRMRDALLLVALREDEVVGTVTICAPSSPFSEIAQEGEIEFRFLSVAPSAWGTGVGSYLIAACEAYAREEGAQRIVLCVRDINAAALTVYESRGFVRLPERDWRPIPSVELLALHKMM